MEENIKKWQAEKIVFPGSTIEGKTKQGLIEEFTKIIDELPDEFVGAQLNVNGLATIRINAIKNKSNSLVY